MQMSFLSLELCYRKLGKWALHFIQFINHLGVHLAVQVLLYNKENTEDPIKKNGRLYVICNEFKLFVT